MSKIEVLAEQLHVPESPRWRDGSLWLVDGPAVRRISPDGEVSTVAALPCPVLLGLAFGQDGSAFTNDSVGRKVMRIALDGEIGVAADLSAFCPTMLNEVTLLADGSMFVGDIGFDLFGGAEPKAANLIRIAPDGAVSRVGPGIVFANGMADAPNGTGFYVAEYVGGAIWKVSTEPTEPAFEKIASGLGTGVDGIAIDPDGCIWYADMQTGKLIQLDASGGKAREFDTGFNHATSLAFDPAAGRLYATVLHELPSPETMQKALGAVVTIQL